ncbi:MAG: hotdog fold thioesterase [Woeseiaceae bacterium]|jgi:1,4-dihydroxy-2-naphthoyl-CoA hydrolase
MIWKQSTTLEHLNSVSNGSMVEHLGITFTKIGDDYIEASMPVDSRTVQPFGILHGGASVALSESLGSMAAHLCIEDTTRYTTVGVEVNANHLRSVSAGQQVVGRATPVRIGRRIQVWNIDIRDVEERLVCTSRLTVAVIEQ